jgi:hypothetical protein
MVSITISKIVDTGSNPVPLEKGGGKNKIYNFRSLLAPLVELVDTVNLGFISSEYWFESSKEYLYFKRGIERLIRLNSSSE